LSQFQYQPTLPCRGWGSSGFSTTSRGFGYGFEAVRIRVHFWRIFPHFQHLHCWITWNMLECALHYTVMQT
jgi:hypothetical protein